MRIMLMLYGSLFNFSQSSGCFLAQETFVSRWAEILPRFVGPFQVCKQVGKDAYEVELPENWKIHDTFHVSQLAEYHLRGSYQPPPPAELLEGELEYEVDRPVTVLWTIRSCLPAGRGEPALNIL